MYRKLGNYTQEELDNLLGVSNQAVSKCESAVSMPDIMLLPKIAKALDVTLNDLFTNNPTAITIYVKRLKKIAKRNCSIMSSMDRYTDTFRIFPELPLFQMIYL